MSSIPRTTAVRRNLQYIAVADMKNEVFQYSTSTVNFRTTGTFTAPYTGLANGIPAGTLLIETGRKLFRGANPNVPTLLVQVMAYTPGKATDGTDSVGNGQSLRDSSGRAVVGFIDPSSPNVALYSIDRNSDQDDGLYYSNLALLTAGGAATTVAQIAAAGGVAHKSASLFTDGSLTANSLTVSANNSASVAISNVLATGQTLATYTVPTGHGITAGQTVTVSGLAAGAKGGATSAVNLASTFAVYAGGFITYTTATTHGYAVGQLVTTAFTAGTNTAGFTVTNAVIVSIPTTTTFVIRGPASAPTALGSSPAGTVVSPNMNVVNAVVATVSATTFTVNGGFTNVTTEPSTGTATVSGGSTTTIGTAGLTLAGALVQRIATTLPSSEVATTTAIDLSLGNIFLHTLTSTSAVATNYAITNSIVGTVFTLVITNPAYANTYVFPSNVAVIASPGTLATGSGKITITAPAAAGRITCLCIVTA